MPISSYGRAGATVLCSDTSFTEEEKVEAEKIFNSIGIVEWVPEKLIDTVTGLKWEEDLHMQLCLLKLWLIVQY